MKAYIISLVDPVRQNRLEYMSTPDVDIIFSVTYSNFIARVAMRHSQAVLVNGPCKIFEFRSGDGLDLI